MAVDKYSQRDIERFWDKVDCSDPDGCWLYNAGRFPSGYGCFWANGKTRLAHRVAYEMANDCEIPKGLVVRHGCDVRACCAPHHLKTGTRKQNSQDMVERGRMLSGYKNPAHQAPHLLARGSKHPQAILEEHQVIEIRTRYAAGDISAKALSAEYKVTKSAIERVLNGKNWAHLPVQRLVRRKYVATRGETHGMAKLTAKDVIAMRKEHAEGANYVSLASDYGVCSKQVGKIIRRNLWKNV